MPLDIQKDLKYGTERHKFVLEAILKRMRLSKERMEVQHTQWQKNDEQFMAYAPEKTVDAQRRGLREGGAPQYTTIQVPHSYALASTAHTYHTSVFFSRSPTFQYEGTSGEPEQSKFAVEALIDYQSRQSRSLPVYYQWLADVGRYGLGVIGTYWNEMQTIVNEVVDKEDEFLGVGLGTAQKVQQRRAIKGYTGNKPYNVRVYDFYPDPRVSPGALQDGEFVGVKSQSVWNTIAKKAANEIYFNVGYLRAQRHATAGTRVEAGMGTNRPLTSGEGSYLDLTDMSGIELLEMYVELIPKDWGLGKETFPEKWVFVVANETIIIGARPLGDYANEFPFDVLEAEPDSYAMFKPSIMERTKPMEEVMNWLINTHFYNVRKALNDVFVVDPSRIVMKDLTEGAPGGIIRLKEEYFESDVRQAISQLPVQDFTRAHLNDTEMVGQLASRITGINDNIMGMVNPGGRKTATEVRSSTTFGVNRLKTQAEWYSATGFATHAQRLLQQSQQYYDTPLVLRIVGDTARFTDITKLKVTPEDIAGFYDFMPIDGTLPVDRYAQVQMWANLLSQARNIPQIGATYDMGRIFGWIAQLGGIRNIEQFKIQVTPDDELQRQAQAGNVVPLNGQGTGQPPGGGQTQAGGTPYSSPTPGMGAAG